MLHRIWLFQEFWSRNPGFVYDRPQQSWLLNLGFCYILEHFAGVLGGLVRQVAGVARNSPLVFEGFTGFGIQKNNFEKIFCLKNIFWRQKSWGQFFIDFLYKINGFIKEISENAPRKKQWALSPRWEGVGGSYSVILKYSIVLQNHWIWAPNSFSARR